MKIAAHFFFENFWGTNWGTKSEAVEDDLTLASYPPEHPSTHLQQIHA